MSELNTSAQKSRLSIAQGHRNLSATGRSVTNLKSLSRVGLRRRSYGFGRVSGIRPVERTSNVAIEFKRPPLVYLPTYQLESAVPFHFETVQKIVKAAIIENFEKHKYHSQESPALALRLAGEIMRSVKMLVFDRYRIICVVTIGQKRAQCNTNAIAFIWDHERDNYVEESMETPSAFMQVILFGIYLD